jgi:5'(3')-deoxyribonucleotidase
MNIKTIFLDMDGVIVDFQGAVLKRHGIKEVSNPTEWEYRYRKDFGMSCDEFWMDKDNEFWSNLPFTSEAEGIFKAFDDRNLSDRVCLLSHPQRHAFQGKVDWIKKYLPCIFNNKAFLLGLDKTWCAHPKALLIDDCEDHCIDFIGYGGNAFLVPRPWNHKREVENLLVKNLELYSDRYNIRGPNERKSNTFRLGNQ